MDSLLWKSVKLFLAVQLWSSEIVRWNQRNCGPKVLNNQSSYWKVQDEIQRSIETLNHMSHQAKSAMELSQDIQMASQNRPIPTENPQSHGIPGLETINEALTQKQKFPFRTEQSCKENFATGFRLRHHQRPQRKSKHLQMRPRLSLLEMELMVAWKKAA